MFGFLINVFEKCKTRIGSLQNRSTYSKSAQCIKQLCIKISFRIFLIPYPSLSTLKIPFFCTKSYAAPTTVNSLSVRLWYGNHRSGEHTIGGKNLAAQMWRTQTHANVLVQSPRCATPDFFELEHGLRLKNYHETLQPPQNTGIGTWITTYCSHYY